jgi:hypothetical protein
VCSDRNRTDPQHLTVLDDADGGYFRKGIRLVTKSVLRVVDGVLAALECVCPDALAETVAPLARCSE